MRTATLVWGMTKRSFIMYTRYKFDALLQVTGLLLLFVFIFLGARTLAPHMLRNGSTTAAIIVGFMVWQLANMSYSSVASGLLEEAGTGTLEQLAMSPFGLRRILLAQFVASLGVNLTVTAMLLTLMMAASGKWLHIDVVSLVPLVILTMSAIIGVGLLAGGCALVFKRVQALLQLLSLGFLAILAAPLHRATWVRYLPLAFGYDLIKRVMLHSESIAHIPGRDIAFLAVHAIAWLLLGLFAFGRFERAARVRALLGHY